MDNALQVITLFLSTLSLRRATTALRQGLQGDDISIHALLAESDCQAFTVLYIGFSISIHALLAESDRGGSLYCKA